MIKNRKMILEAVEKGGFKWTRRGAAGYSKAGFCGEWTFLIVCDRWSDSWAAQVRLFRVVTGPSTEQTAQGHTTRAEAWRSAMEACFSAINSSR